MFLSRRVMRLLEMLLLKLLTNFIKNLAAEGIESLYDDRAGLRAGEKFADSDLIGIPTRIIVSASLSKRADTR